MKTNMNTNLNLRKFTVTVIITIAFLFLIACGGGGGSDAPAPTLSQSQIDAIEAGLAGYANSHPDPIDAYCRESPLSAACHTEGQLPTYIGFTKSDFSGKTIYHVALDTFSRADYVAGGKLKIYYPDQSYSYEEGTWNVYYGKLFVAPAANPEQQTVYTLLFDGQGNRYFKTSQQGPNGTVRVIGMFHDQSTGSSQANEFVVNHRTP